MTIDRDALIDTLEQMASTDDAEALAAARQVNALIDNSDYEWEEVIAKGLGGGAASTPKMELSSDDASVLKAIDAMLARPNLNETTADDLRDYRTELENGELDPDDRKYILGLYERLSN